jgi:hypothetical protein
MAIDLTKGIVRILKPDGTTAGTGFVVSDKAFIATCAHAVEGAKAGPGRIVRLVFLASGEERESRVEPEWWRSADAEDVAILYPEGDLPAIVQRMPLARSTKGRNYPFETFGFPEANPERGMWGIGCIVGRVRVQRVPMLQLQSEQVTVGFSGAPVWDPDLKAVVGMITTIVTGDRYGRGRTTAFATPAEVLAAICPIPLRQPLVKRLERVLHPYPIDVLRQVTKLFVGDLARALTGKPRKELRQFCLTQASKLPHASYLDMLYLEEHVDDLRTLYCDIPVLLAEYRYKPDPTGLGKLQDKARILGVHLSHIYRMEPDNDFDLSARAIRGAQGAR